MKEFGKVIVYMILGLIFIFAYAKYSDWTKEASIPYCTEIEMTISDWGVCTNGLQQRELRAINSSCKIDDQKYPSTQICTPHITNSGVINSTGTIQPQIKRVNIFNGAYTTEVDIEKGDYSKSYNNFTISLSGSIKSLKLSVLGETQVNGGKRIFIPESYYYMFAINESIPRVLGTSRKSTNRLDTTDFGIFKGTETPKRLNFDLTNTLKLASTSTEFIKGTNFVEINYLELLNKNQGKILNGTLLMGDGNSMLEPDILNRIFGIITEAYLEYECTDGNNCSIIID